MDDDDGDCDCVDLVLTVGQVKTQRPFVNLRLKAWQAQAIGDLAREAGMSRPTWIRATLMAAVEDARRG